LLRVSLYFVRSPHGDCCRTSFVHSLSVCLRGSPKDYLTTKVKHVCLVLESLHMPISSFSLSLLASLNFHNNRLLFNMKTFLSAVGLFWLYKNKQSGTGSGDPSPQQQTGFAYDKPSYAAILKFDLSQSGHQPEPVRLPFHVNYSLPPVSHRTDLQTDRKLAIDYELSGRTSTNHTFADIRSSSKARKRMRTRLDKYYSFKGVNPGQLRTEHIALPQCWSQDTMHRTLDDPEIKTTVMTKRMLYDEAQYYPKPFHHHRSCRHCKCGPSEGLRGESRKAVLRLGHAGSREKAVAGFELVEQHECC